MIINKNLQIFDFKYLTELSDKYCPKSSFMAEICQGHRNDGEGFWLAFQTLKKY
jgi:N-acetylneuraminate synthase